MLERTNTASSPPPSVLAIIQGMYRSIHPTFCVCSSIHAPKWMKGQRHNPLSKTRTRTHAHTDTHTLSSPSPPSLPLSSHPIPLSLSLFSPPSFSTLLHSFLPPLRPFPPSLALFRTPSLLSSGQITVEDVSHESALQAVASHIRATRVSLFCRESI